MQEAQAAALSIMARNRSTPHVHISADTAVLRTTDNSCSSRNNFETHPCGADRDLLTRTGVPPAVWLHRRATVYQETSERLLLLRPAGVGASSTDKQTQHDPPPKKTHGGPPQWPCPRRCDDATSPGRGTQRPATVRGLRCEYDEAIVEKIVAKRGQVLIAVSQPLYSSRLNHESCVA